MTKAQKEVKQLADKQLLYTRETLRAKEKEVKECKDAYSFALGFSAGVASTLLAGK